MASTNPFLTLYSTVQTNLVGSTIATGYIPYVSTAGRQAYTSTLSTLTLSTLNVTSGIITYGVPTFQSFLITTTNTAWNAYPTGTRMLWIRLVGGGGGGTKYSSAAVGSVGSAGTATTMSGSGITSTLSAGGGAAPATGYQNGVGQVSANGNIINLTGGYAQISPFPTGYSAMGMNGGSSPLGAGGTGGMYYQDPSTYYGGTSGQNYGGGGGGGSAPPNNFPGAGGGGGGYVEHSIINPTGNYNISIGSGGPPATNGGGSGGGSGAQGCALIFAYL